MKVRPLVISILLSVLILSFIIPTGEASDDWSVPLSVLLDSTDKGEWIFGISSEATDGYDSNIDVPNPPPDPAGFDMYFSEPDYPAAASKLRNNFKSTDGSWTLVITVPAGTTAIVAWNSLPADTDMYLQEVDLDTGTPSGSIIDMGTVSLITVSGESYGETRGYRITTSGNAGASKTTRDPSGTETEQSTATEGVSGTELETSDDTATSEPATAIATAPVQTSAETQGKTIPGFEGVIMMGVMVVIIYLTKRKW